ncbi:MAG: DUF2066 domain-containing protein [Alphaproteobacteria bacterium]
MIRQRLARRIRVAALAFAIAIPGAAADSLFTVADNPVDVTAGNAIEARERALSEAQVAAARKLFERLVAAGDGGAVPRVSAAQAAALVQDVEIADERVSPVRYIANITVRFRPDAVRRFLGEQGVAFVQRGAAPTMVVPVLMAPDGPILFADGNGWLRAWADRPAGGIVPIVVPLGDLADVSGLTAAQALAGDRERLAALARRYNARRIAVLQARPGGGRVDVTATIYDGDGTPETVVESHADAAGDFVAPVRATAATLDRRWRAVAATPAVAAGGATGTVLVTTEARTAEDWAALRRRLAETPGIQRVEVVALAPGVGRLRLHYGGDAEQLRAALAQRALRLDPVEAGSARLIVGGPAPEPPATR